MNSSTKKKKKRNLTQDELHYYSKIVTKNIDKILDHFGITYDPNFFERITCKCPIHYGSDSPTGFSFYTNNGGNWYCFTHQCHETFVASGIGFVRGLISRYKYKWSEDTDDTASLEEAIDWVHQFLNCSFADIVVADNTINQLANVFGEKEKIKEAAYTKSEVRSRLRVPSQYLLSRGYSHRILDKYNIGDAHKNQMRNRAVIPIEDCDGNIISFTARSIFDECPKCKMYHQQGDCSYGSYKWMHSQGFKKSYHLYNLSRAKDEIDRTGKVVLVEGPLDVLRLVESDINNCVAMFGVNLSNEQRYLLEERAVKSVYVISDMDDAGNRAFEKIREKLKNLYNVSRIRISKKDVGEMTKEEIEKEIKPYVR
jgi:5S rRNA maturation endonuclease (ribonuclease M5)